MARVDSVVQLETLNIVGGVKAMLCTTGKPVTSKRGGGLLQGAYHVLMNVRRGDLNTRFEMDWVLLARLVEEGIGRTGVDVMFPK